MAWITPKTDWDSVPKNPKAEDFNRVEGNIDFLKNDIETKKGLIVDAVNNIGGTSVITDTHVQIAAELNSLLLTGDAVASEVLPGKTFYSNNPKNKMTGTMPTKAAATITPGTANQTIAAGQYLSGIQTIVGDADLVSGNIRSGVNLFGVTGSVLDGAVIQSIQRGRIEYGDNYGAGITSIAISSVDISRSVLYTNVTSTRPQPDHATCGATLNASSISLHIDTPYPTAEISWQVVQYSNISKVLRGSGQPNYNGTVINISSVNLSKSIIVSNWVSADSADTYDVAYAELSSSTTVTLWNKNTGGAGTGSVVYWQVIEFK